MGELVKCQLLEGESSKFAQRNILVFINRMLYNWGGQLFNLGETHEGYLGGVSSDSICVQRMCGETSS